MPSQQVFENKDGAIYTTSNGAPVMEPYAVARLGRNGPLLLQDFHHIDILAHFSRERIPERVLHAKGAGAHGYFEVTHDITDLTCAALFKKVGTRARTTMRISTAGGEAGSADTLRDSRGLAMKIRTEEGNLDWVFNNTPIFMIRDPSKFPHFIHTQKRDPQTHLKDPDMFWDYLSQNPESIHQTMVVFSDRGTPDGYFRQHGYSGHTYRLVQEDGSFVYTKIHVRADSGFKCLTQEKAKNLDGENPDYGIQDMFESIEKGRYPVWTVYVQTMTVEQAEKFRYNILDITKVWPQKEYPLRPVGRIVLNENPQNYFAEIEQVAFSPSHTVPGLEASADPVLQSRLFVYPDSARYRLGVNHQQLPVNVPLAPVANFQRDGQGTFISQGARPNYQSSISPLTYSKRSYYTHEHEQFIGTAILDLSEVTELDFEQPRILWNKVFDDGVRERFINNVAGHLGKAKSKEIKARQLSLFAAVDQGLSDRIALAMGVPTALPLRAKPASEAIRFQANIVSKVNWK